MNKKSLMPLLALAIIPALVFGLNQPDADAIGKQFALDNPGVTMGVHTLEADISEEEEVSRASLIIEGEILNARSYWKIIREDTMPRIFTDYTIKVDDVIKGEYQKVINVTMNGGTKDGITSQNEGMELAKGDKIIMILGKDTNSIFGDSYSPVSVTKSTYLVDENGKAENMKADRTDTKDKVKQRIANLANS